MQVNVFHDKTTATFTYVVVDESSKKCGIIDSVLDYDQFSATVSYTHADKIITFVKENQLETEWILETHVHADHITAAHYLQASLGGKIAMGSGIKKVLEYWVPKFEIASDTPLDGSQYDVLFDEGDTFNIGNLPVTVWHTPGHTPACTTSIPCAERSMASGQCRYHSTSESQIDDSRSGCIRSFVFGSLKPQVMARKLRS